MTERHMIAEVTSQLLKEIDSSVKTFDSLQSEIDRQLCADANSDVSALRSAQERIRIVVTTKAMDACRKMQKSTTMTTDITEIEATYIDAASELRAKQAGLQNHAVELQTFIEVRDNLQGHSDFSGYLPETYFSGGDLDPVGVAPKNESAAMRT